jgi:UDP-2,4-diacetamido-2,4,6-trideoxy-beta-L-altropyranose hydrolase
MQFVVRTDSSAVIGTGHLMRCLTLAERLREEDHTVLFVCRDLPGNVARLATERGFALTMLPSAAHPRVIPTAGQYDAWLAVEPARDAEETITAIGSDRVDWLIVDHYGIDARWERKLHSRANHLLVIDDLANRTHDCDLLTEQNYRPDSATRYAGLTPGSCQHLIGPEYALLQPEFAKLHREAEPRTELRTILVFYGGIDATGETERALEIFEGIRDFNGAIDVVVGTANPRRTEIERWCAQMETTRFYCQTSRMAELMKRADLALGAGGVAGWERCCLGLPSIITAVADNQIDIAKAVTGQGAGWYAGTHAEVTGERLYSLVQQIAADPLALQHASKAALTLGDGRGVERVRDAMMQFSEARMSLS